ncbi:hypothetical protein OP10G_1729 [Fimbriimonas ginsengisoli Gsoil 348]|uniref:Uncharacterized protein n=1 Tax=Fimbriimonas ginsengisoli Gsoil 348 TaxID=661478 RepID=A0A068NP05_FIMGI|nr:hypothetical protein OP10G_1729 [Fimbriimonas ginsengisoli Gsoil 348]
MIYLRALSNDLETLKPMVEMVLAAVENLQPGTIHTIQHPDWP